MNEEPDDNAPKPKQATPMKIETLHDESDDFIPRSPRGKFVGKKDGHYKGELGPKFKDSFGKAKK